MSVAIGTPHPRAPGPPALNARKISAGTARPPMAAAIGKAARRTDASSPINSSRLISSPTSRKNTTISPSFTQCPSDIAWAWPAKLTESVACQKCA
jgi:hypothetical protein